MKTYKQGRIYKIFNEDKPEDCYIGSTVETLSRRMSGHRKDYKCNHTTPLYRYIRDNNCLEKMKMELIEHIKHPLTKEELHQVQGRYQRELHPSLNKYVAGSILDAGGKNEYFKLKIKCDVCNCLISRRHMSEHKRSRTHKQALEQQAEEPQQAQA